MKGMRILLENKICNVNEFSDDPGDRRDVI